MSDSAWAALWLAVMVALWIGEDIVKELRRIREELEKRPR